MEFLISTCNCRARISVNPNAQRHVNWNSPSPKIDYSSCWKTLFEYPAKSLTRLLISTRHVWLIVLIFDPSTRIKGNPINTRQRLSNVTPTNVVSQPALNYFLPILRVPSQWRHKNHGGNDDDLCDVLWLFYLLAAMARWEGEASLSWWLISGMPSSSGRDEPLLIEWSEVTSQEQVKTRNLKKWK